MQLGPLACVASILEKLMKSPSYQYFVATDSLMVYWDVLFRVDALYPCQQFFCHFGMFPGLKHGITTKQRIQCLTGVTALWSLSKTHLS